MNIQEIIAEELRLFLEGKAEDLVAKFPELQPAYDAGIKNPQYLQWIQKRRGEEPVEDIIGVVQSFDAAKQRLKAKKMSPDIYAYKTPAVLRQALEDLGGSKGEERRRLKDEETTYLGEFGDWIVAMPHTRESSCQLGKGTTWCTAATQSQNLFLSYVARKNNSIVLYYVMKKGADPRQDPTSKLSVGFVGGKPVFRGNYGGVTVDAANNGLTYERFKKILGDQALPALRAMEAHADSIEGKHPATKQMEEIAKDPVAFEKAIANMGKEEKLDFITNVGKHGHELSPEVLAKLADDTDEDVRSYVAVNPSTPPEALLKLASDKDEHIRQKIAMRPSTPPEILLKLADDQSEHVRADVASNPSLPPEAILKLASDTDLAVRQHIASNSYLSPEVLLKLANDQDQYIRQRAANSTSTPPEALLKLAGDTHLNVKQSVAKNTSTPPEALLKLAEDKDFMVRQEVAKNPSTTLETLLKLSKDPSRWVRVAVSRHMTYKKYKEEQGMNESLFDLRTIYNEGNTMDFTEDYIKQVIKEEYEALLDEKKKKPCKPAKGKRFAKRVNGKCRSFGQAGQAKGGGDRIRPGTKKGDAYCARSAKIKKCKNPPCANDLSRKKWKCRGSKSMK
jgi:hypothetical protein